MFDFGVCVHCADLEALGMPRKREKKKKKKERNREREKELRKKRREKRERRRRLSEKKRKDVLFAKDIIVDHSAPLMNPHTQSFFDGASYMKGNNTKRKKKERTRTRTRIWSKE